jgi:Fe2+ or Zn2+ uptake regulation protein
MVRNKSNHDGPHVETFACLECGTTITFATPPDASKRDR